MTQAAILRQRIPIDDAEHQVDMPITPVLWVGRSPAHPTDTALDLWYADAVGLDREVRTFRVVGTGHTFEKEAGWEYRGSYADVDLGLVWHLLERLG